VDASLEFVDDYQVKVAQPGSREPLHFTFDRIFWDFETLQEEIYQLAARDTIE
jgi:hypothetical protein